MRTHIRQSAQLGELVVAAFDEAAHYSTDPREVSRLATQAVEHMLRRAQKRTIALSPPSSWPAEKDVRNIRNACSLLLSQRCASHGETEGERYDQSDCSQQWW